MSKQLKYKYFHTAEHSPRGWMSDYTRGSSLQIYPAITYNCISKDYHKHQIPQTLKQQNNTKEIIKAIIKFTYVQRAQCYRGDAWAWDLEDHDPVV